MKRNSMFRPGKSKRSQSARRAQMRGNWNRVPNSTKFAKSSIDNVTRKGKYRVHSDRTAAQVELDIHKQKRRKMRLADRVKAIGGKFSRKANALPMKNWADRNDMSDTLLINGISRTHDENVQMYSKCTCNCVLREHVIWDYGLLRL